MRIQKKRQLFIHIFGRIPEKSLLKFFPTRIPQCQPPNIAKEVQQLWKVSYSHSNSVKQITRGYTDNNNLTAVKAWKISNKVQRIIYAILWKGISLIINLYCTSFLKDFKDLYDIVSQKNSMVEYNTLHEQVNNRLHACNPNLCINANAVIYCFIYYDGKEITVDHLVQAFCFLFALSFGKIDITQQNPFKFTIKVNKMLGLAIAPSKM